MTKIYKRENAIEILDFENKMKDKKPSLISVDLSSDNQDLAEIMKPTQDFEKYASLTPMVATHNRIFPGKIMK